MKKININHFLLLGFFMILINQLDFLKKTYFVFTKNYDERFQKAYLTDYFSGYCEKESHGYVYYIKEKFNKEISPKIINFEKKKRKLPYWIFYKPFNSINEKELILLNYDNENEFIFDDYIVIDNHTNRCFYLREK